jgi:hypothetical protein
MGEVEVMRLNNEFAMVELTKDHTANGVRLKIYSSRTKRVTYLDPLLLEALTWTPPEQIAANLRTPFGPDDDDISSGPLPRGEG